jgi:tetrahydromethanopterin S-methyltransferase subunit G
MGTVVTTNQPQTLYVSIRRDELRALKQERDELQDKVAFLTSLLHQAKQSAVGFDAQVRLA